MAEGYVVTRSAAVPMPEWATGGGTESPPVTSAATPVAIQNAVQSPPVPASAEPAPVPVSAQVAAHVAAAPAAQPSAQLPAQFYDAAAFASYQAPVQSAPASGDPAGAAVAKMLPVSSVVSTDSGYDAGAGGLSLSHSATFELPFMTSTGSGEDDVTLASHDGEMSWVLVSDFSSDGFWFV